MNLLVSTSLIAAFVAGVAALFAPCCIGVLLPSYLGNIFKEKYKIFFMTFIFFLGMLTVFLPIGLGATVLAQVFSKYHNQIFTAGGIFLVILGISMLFGKKFATPTSVRDNFKKHVSSIYLLGIFSAIATTCCAPVLAGVVTLSVASGTVIWGLIFTLAYVVGMTLPLFIIAAFLDKFNLTDKLKNAKKIVKMRLGSYEWRITVSELISGLIFLGMGGYITYLAFNNNLSMRSDYQLDVNLFTARFLKSISGFITAVPEFIWALIFIGFVSYLIYLFIKQYKGHESQPPKQ